MPERILPGSTIGVVGGGQLGRMMAFEARRMGYRVAVLDPAANAPAGQVADQHIVAPLSDPDAARELARCSDVLTLEWENADPCVLGELRDVVPVHPGPHVLEVAQHRVREKDTARSLGLPTPEYRSVVDRPSLDAALRDIGFPAVLKTARGGYDGRGQAVVRGEAEAAAAFLELSSLCPELILEAWVPFRMEVSAICARSRSGEMATFPIGENVHREGILHTTTVPARIPPEVAAEARSIAEAFTEGLDVVGLLAVELFVTGDHHLLVNEIAPRPHNSGHYTWEACVTSQFEQHVRAVCGLPLGSTELLAPAAMVNLLGDDVLSAERSGGYGAALGVPGAALHLYGKPDAQPRRKMGHLTVLGATPEAARAGALEAHDRLRSGRYSA
jgi:5-(carboxyamino)imidazole ribonucleotide synthase